MLKLFFGLNAAIYFGLALWCTFSPTKTAAAQGFMQLTGAGRAEYLTVYGGLQFGLGLFFVALAMTPRWQEMGLVFALCVYGPLVLWRIAGLAMHWPVNTTTLAVAGLELFMLLAAVWLWFSQRGNA